MPYQVHFFETYEEREVSDGHMEIIWAKDIREAGIKASNYMRKNLQYTNALII